MSEQPFSILRSLALLTLIFLVGSTLRAQPFYTAPGWQQHGELSYTAFGWSMRNAGDVNGDGIDDMVVTAIDYSNPEATNGEEGKVFLYYGSPTGLSETPAWQFESDNDSSVLGFSADGGDLNGDGYSDLVVGALQLTDGEYNEGQIYLWYGSPAGLSLAGPDWTLQMNQVYALLGSGVAMSGDINNDGYNDLFFSAKQWDGPEVDEGKVWLYYGSPTGPVASDWSWEPNQAYAIAGFPVNYAGDLNGDGFDDIVIGANQYDSIDIDDGLVVAFYGGAAGPHITPDWSMSSGQKKCNFGHWVDGAGDVNGDGFGDIVVSALLYESDSSQHNEGRIFVYYGSPSGLQHDVAWYAEIDQAEAQLGYSNAGAGDINGDGYSDIIAGAKYYTNGEESEGGAFVWFGSADGPEHNYCWEGEGDQAFGYYGKTVGGNGDFNHDGYSDFMVSAYRYTDILEADGKAFVYYGAPRETDFHYAQDSFCLEDSNPTPVIDGISGGYFSSDDAIVNAVTGEIDIAASGSGTHYIQYHGTGFCNTGTRKIFIQPNTDAENIFHYPENNYCIADADPSPQYLLSATGYFYSDDAIVDSLSGILDLSASGTGDHIIYFSGTTYLGCFVIAVDTVHIDYDPSFYFTQDTFCLYDVYPYPVIDNPGTGTFSCTGCTINATTGKLNLINTGVGGPYTIFYDTHTTCAIDSFLVWVVNYSNNDTALQYASNVFCVNSGSQLPITLLGDGTFNSDNAIVNTTTGAIDPEATGVGGPYTIYYQEDHLCVTDSFIFYIIPFDSTAAAFHFDAGYYCIEDSDPAPVIDGAFEGIFSSDAVIDPATGTIDLTASGGGNFTITYTVNDNSGCTVTHTETIWIDDPDGSFYYNSTYYFLGDVNPAPVFTGDTGIIASSPDGLVFTDTLGTIDLVNSLSGSYTITNTVSDSICTETYAFAVEILEPCLAPDTLWISDTTASGATLTWTANDYYADYSVYVINGADTTIYNVSDTTLILTDLLPETNYTVIVGIDCGGHSMSFTNAQQFTTLKPVGIFNTAPNSNCILYPNPASHLLNIQISGNAGIAEIKIYNTSGSIISASMAVFTQQHTAISLDHLSDGFYIITITTDDGYYTNVFVVHRVVK